MQPWRPTGHAMTVHVALQRMRCADAHYHPVEAVMHRSGLSRQAVFSGLRGLLAHNWAEFTGPRQKRKFRGLLPSQLPDGDRPTCSLCGEYLVKRMDVCKTCLPGDVSQPMPDIQPGSPLKEALLTERRSQGLPLWIEQGYTKVYEVPA